MRLFIAINLTSEEKGRISQASRDLREAGFPVRWVTKENLHLMLKFLGETGEFRVADLSAVLDDTAMGFAPFDLEVRGFGAFPSPVNPRVVWIGIEPSAPLEKLKLQLETEVGPLGFPTEERPFRPHLTIGRARRDSSRSGFKGIDRLIADLNYEDSFCVAKVDLMSSRLSPSGAEYGVLHSAPFGKKG